MNKIVFLQPALPQYRLDFFEEVKKITKCDIEVYAAKTDFLGVNSVKYSEAFYVDNFVKFGPFYWLKKLGLPTLKKQDVLVVSGNPRILNFMLIFFYYKFLGVKTIWWGQGWTAGKKGLLPKIRRKLMLIADGIAVYTSKEANEIEHNNVVGLDNGVSIKNIPKVDKDFALPIMSLNLLFIGRLTSKSNIELLILALSKLNIDFKLKVIGEGDLREDLKVYSKKLNVSNSIEWFGTIHDEREIAAIARECHLFVYPGSVGLSLIHAFAHSLPAVIHDELDFHMPEAAAFEDKVNGFSFKYNDPDSLATVLCEACSFDLSSMSAQARQTVVDSFNTETMAINFSKLIE
ncbi:glycosyltransferase family 4 protein [Vibrio breoganii]|uniref:glycosyltransferase family 4 protein n=1 Tax=Vibrio breoganii TaxID=553239 RepID=UPI000C8327B0|nr:glycosyltransferase family 4 protein [Vibrio breoganii]PMG95099.1 hypothetical protein BCU81_00065 [Vibrio breoganii]